MGAVVYGNITAQSAACLGNAQGLDGTLHESLQVTDRRRWNYMVPEELQATATVREFGMAARAQGLVLIVALVQSMLQILLLVHGLGLMGICWDPQDSVLHDGCDEERNNLLV